MAKAGRRKTRQPTGTQRQLSVMIDHVLKDALDKASDEDYRTLAGTIHVILYAWLREREREQAVAADAVVPIQQRTK